MGIDLSPTFLFAVQPDIHGKNLHEKEELNRLKEQENFEYDNLISRIVLGSSSEILEPYHLANFVSTKLKVRPDNNIPINLSVVTYIRQCATNHFNYLSGPLKFFLGEPSYHKMKFFYELTDLVYEFAVDELNQSHGFINIDLQQLAQQIILNKNKEKKEKKSRYYQTQRTSIKRKHDIFEAETAQDDIYPALVLKNHKDILKVDPAVMVLIEDLEVDPALDEDQEVVQTLEDLDEDLEVVQVLEFLDEDQDEDQEVVHENSRANCKFLLGLD